MKKLSLLIIILFLIGNIFAEVIITEIEANPSGSDSGKEWIKLYSDEEADLSGWKIVNCDGDEHELNGTINGYLNIIFEKQWMDNSEECVKLYNGESLIDESGNFDDTDNDTKTWIVCDDEWKFSNNGCSEKENVEEQEDTEEQSSETDYQIETETAEKFNKKSPNTIPITQETIRLGGNNIDNNFNIDDKETENIKSKNYIVYESKTELIKKYAIYWFAFLIVVFCVWIMWKKFDD